MREPASNCGIMRSMEEESAQVFVSPTYGGVSLEEVVSQISGFIRENPHSTYRLIIGTDSQTKQVNGEAEIDFVTAIVVHRVGSGGRYFYTCQRQKRRYVLREKIYTETARSLELAEKLVPLIRDRITARLYDLEIHIDVGPVGPTRDMIKEVVGMVTGSGYTAKTKPEAYGASTVADRHT